MNRPFTIVAFLILPAVASIAYAQTGSGYAGPTAPATESSKPAKSKPISTGSAITPSTSRTESSLFYFLNMSGRNRADFRPLTAGEKAKFYARGMFGPVMFFTSAASAAIAQADNVPVAWGQGAEGYGERFGNYFAKQAIQRTLRLGGEDLLHEDNRYFSSGEHGFGRRIAYALKSSITARGNDGTQHYSISEIGSIAGASFISRLSQPPTNSSPMDGLTSFAIGMGSNAGTNIAREFLPDITRHVFHRHENK